MFVTQHAQDQLLNRTGLWMFKREINAFAKIAKPIKGKEMRLRRLVLCGNQIDFVCVKDSIVTIFAQKLRKERR